MQVFKNKISFLLIIGLLIISSCKKETIETLKSSGTPVYVVDTNAVYTSANQKTRIKSPAQFLSILYADFFAKSLPTDELINLSTLSSSIGDKSMYFEMIIDNYLSSSPNHPKILIPTDTEMRQDIPKFVRATYLRFFARIPTQLELFKVKQLIEQDSKMSPINVYKAFALSTEYNYY